MNCFPGVVGARHHFRRLRVDVDDFALLNESGRLGVLGRVLYGQLGLNSAEGLDQETGLQQKVVDQVLVGQSTLKENS